MARILLYSGEDAARLSGGQLGPSRFFNNPVLYEASVNQL
jgi:hypothetical protein